MVREGQGLGWVGIDRNAPEVVELREYLAANNGIRGLEVLAPDEIDRAKRIFYRDGFVVIRDVLTRDQLEFLRAGVDREVRNMMAIDGDRAGNRGSHRYSFGSASISGQQLHNPEWAMLVHLPTVTPLVSAIFESSDYICRGGGGDFCLPGAVEYQPLHADIRDRIEFTDENGNTRTFGSFRDPRGILSLRDLPCPYVCANFLTVDFTPINGPIRQIPGTQHSREPIPSLADEPQWMKLSTVCPAPAGSVVLRDVRCWHGGTPNLSEEVRAIPNAEFFAPWFREPLRKSMPWEIYEGLSDHGKRLCRYIHAQPGEQIETGYRADLGGTPPGMKKASPPTALDS